MINVDSKIVIGRSAEVTFPEFKNIASPAKVDTGAYGSVIHGSEVRIIVKSNGTSVLACTLLDHVASPLSATNVEFEEFHEVEIMSSLGHIEKRYRVKLPVCISGVVFSSFFTITDRSHAVFPILLGRKTIKHRFIVDVSKRGYDFNTLVELTKDNKHWVTKSQLKEEQ
jgi:hypothetical protein